MDLNKKPITDFEGLPLIFIDESLIVKLRIQIEKIGVQSER